MSLLPLFLELQAIHDNLAIIQRDLTQFPPELAKLDADLKSLSRKTDTLEKELQDAQAKHVVMAKEFGLSQRLEDLARSAVKQSTQKVQYTAAIRELDERERQKATIAKPLKELETRIASLEKNLATTRDQKDQAQVQFEELHRIFMSEHENQVVAQEQAVRRKAELESSLNSIELTRFNRLIQGRQGRALVAVENGACTGCRTRLRGPLLAQLREKTILNCESCQRILYFPKQS